MTIQNLKIDIIHWLTELTDETILEKINAIKQETVGLSEDQFIELDERLSKYERGDMKFKPWSEVKASIRSRAKNAL